MNEAPAVPCQPSLPEAGRLRAAPLDAEASAALARARCEASRWALFVAVRAAVVARAVALALVGSATAAATASAAVSSECRLFLHSISADGAIVAPPLVTPDDVAAARVEVSRDAAGELWYFSLTPSAAQRVNAHARQHIGRPLAISCGSIEISRPVIQVPFSGQVVVRRAVPVRGAR